MELMKYGGDGDGDGDPVVVVVPFLDRILTQGFVASENHVCRV